MGVHYPLGDSQTCYDNKTLITYPSWQKMMTVEIIDISRKLCVLISKKLQTLRVSEKTNHKEKKMVAKFF